MEHHSNIVPWHFLRERQGAVIKWAPVDDDGNFLVEEFEKLFSPRTKIVAITHMSNVLGTVTPIEGDRAHRPRARRAGRWSTARRARCTSPSTCSDLDCDFYVFTGHKVYGPTGIGVLYGKREWLERMPPYQGGGEMIRDGHAATASPTTTRRTASRPARRRSSRRSASAPRSLT